MNKIRKIIWFGAFYSIEQHWRERRLAIYFFANIFNILIPLCFLVLYIKKWIGIAGFLTLCVISRWIFAPFDDYTSNEYSFSEINTYPLSFLEELFLRFSVRLFQISEWGFAAIIFIAYSFSEFSLIRAVCAIITIFALSVSEELFFFLFYILKNRNDSKLIFEIICLFLAVLSVFYKREIASFLLFSFWGIASLLCIIVVILLSLNWSKVQVLPAKKANNKNENIPLSTKLLLRKKCNSSTKRLFTLELITMVKLKPWDLISALGYIVVFSAIGAGKEMPYLLTLYFIVDYCLLVGFNYLGNNESQEGLFLFSIIDKKILFRSKNMSLASVCACISTLLSFVLSIVAHQSIKQILLMIISNLFCISVMLVACSVISIVHFYIDNSSKKHTVSNIVIMILLMGFCSLVSSFLFLGGEMAAISLIFMIMASCISIYFTLFDLSAIETLFAKNIDKMIQIISH